jgi:integrase
VLQRLTKEHCQVFRNSLINTLSWQYARKILTIFKGVLTQARADSLMNHEPTEFIFIRSASRAPTHEIDQGEKTPQLAEIRALLAAMRNRVRTPNKKLRRQRRRYKLIFETIAFGGTRPGEALGLPWANVDFVRRGIRITQDVEEDGTIGKPKSKAAYRFISMPEHYMRQLRWWKKLCPRSKDDLVFPNWSGRVEFISNLNARGWQPLLKETGLVTKEGRHKYPPKSLRHARASLEIDKGANANEIKKLMGHSSIRVTYDVYGHLFDAHNTRRQDRANQIAQELLFIKAPNNVTHL